MEWVIICNVNAYDIESAFNELDEIDLKQSANVEIGDIVYIYVDSPKKSIHYKCNVIDIDMPKPLIDDSKYDIDGESCRYGRYMRLHLLEKYKDIKLGYEYLKEHGLKTVQGPSKVSKELHNYLSSFSDMAEEMKLISEKKSFVDDWVSDFNKDILITTEKIENLDNLRKQFVIDFSTDTIISLTKEEYVVGLGKKDTFCYRIENELQDLGNMHGATSSKFGVYYGTSGKDDTEKYRSTNTFSKDVDKAFEMVKDEIVILINNGAKQDYNAIRKSKFKSLFRGKILSTYYPDYYLPIFSETHLDYFMSKLNIELDSNDDVLDKQNKIITWKNSRSDTKDWSNGILSEFLYKEIGKPSDEQEKRDEEYPKEYCKNFNIGVSTWERMIKNPDIFNEYDIELLKRIYLFDNHAATCYDLAVQDGISPTSYISPVVALAKRISDYLDLEPIIEDDKRIWWRIIFWGRYREDGRFEWKLKPKLAKAMSNIYKDLDKEAYFEAEDKEDNSLVEDLKEAKFLNIKSFEYSGTKRKKKEVIYTNGRSVYPRDRQVAMNALVHANHKCEIDSSHPTFIRKSSNVNYTEPHHLIPMSYQNRYDVSLDVEENIISLCSNCHNQIHYGKDADILIKKLYDERKGFLKNVGINIDLEHLLQMYGFNK